MPWKETCTMKERELFINAWPGHVTRASHGCANASTYPVTHGPQASVA